VTEEEFKRLLARGHETNGVEFKGPGMRTAKPFLAKVVRAVLGMANRRDGGLVIIGVEAKKLEPKGLSDEEAAAWLDYDHLSVSVNEYARPSVSFDLERFPFQDRIFVIINVHEFGDIPILCCKDFGGSDKQTLKRGACYVRSLHKPETSEIPSEEAMRELLELAVDKGVEKFVKRARKAGLYPTTEAPAASPSVEELFKEQIEDVG
jgi:predicted HTH transcriptional regulator